MQHQQLSQTRTADGGHQKSSEVSIKPILPPRSPVHAVLRLQQTIGNQAIQRLIQSRNLQAKLSISHPGDIYEQEADRVAEHVMRMPQRIPEDAEYEKAAEGTIVQRKCACGPETGEGCAQCKVEKSQMLQRSAGSASSESAHSGSEAPAIIRDVLHSSGQRLDAGTRAFFEPRFGHDFSHVRVHTDARAAESARAINAHAYTVGPNIALAANMYRPKTREGRLLIAHELTHVLQQSGASAQRVSGLMVQRAMMCSKRLEAPVLGWFFNHSYIDDTGRNDCKGSSMPGNYAIQTLVSGNFLKGCAVKTSRSTDPQSRTPNVKPCDPAPGVTNVSTCLRDAFNAYADPSVYKNPRGPNSNTFAGTLARACCADPSSRGLGLVPGWNHSPAPPCEDAIMVAQGESGERSASGATLDEESSIPQET